MVAVAQLGERRVVVPEVCGFEPRQSHVAHIEIGYEDDETLVVSVGGVEVARATHDEHGWAGIDLAQKIALGIGRELYIDVEER